MVNGDEHSGASEAMAGLRRADGVRSNNWPRAGHVALRPDVRPRRRGSEGGVSGSEPVGTARI